MSLIIAAIIVNLRPHYTKLLRPTRTSFIINQANRDLDSVTALKSPTPNSLELFTILTSPSFHFTRIRC